MEKLIELLQEYLNSDVFKKGVSGNDNIEDIPDVKLTKYFSDRFYCTYISDTEFEILTDTVIGKRYGFIKWLVENDKIDIVKVYENLTNYEIEIRIRAVKELLSDSEEKTVLYLKLLMLLSISEQPIHLLISILK